MHAAILAINNAVEVGIVAETVAALCNPSAMLMGVQESCGGPYQEELCRAKGEKAEKAKNRVNRSAVRFLPSPPYTPYLSSLLSGAWLIAEGKPDICW